MIPEGDLRGSIKRRGLRRNELDAAWKLVQGYKSAQCNTSWDLGLSCRGVRLEELEIAGALEGLVTPMGI